MLPKVSGIIVATTKMLVAIKRAQRLPCAFVRQCAIGNFQFFHGSTHWRTYLALHATFLSLPAGKLRDDVQAALTRSEERVSPRSPPHTSTGHAYSATGCAPRWGLASRRWRWCSTPRCGGLFSWPRPSPTLRPNVSRRLRSERRLSGHSLHWASHRSP